MIHLLDANVLIAMTIAEHEHHARGSSWLSTIDRVAVCPIVGGSLVRFLVRVGETSAAAQQVLRALRAEPRCEFWADDLSYTDAEIGHVRGHRQVTDGYLAALTATHDDALLATLDEALTRVRPTITLLVPPL